MARKPDVAGPGRGRPRLLAVVGWWRGGGTVLAGLTDCLPDHPGLTNCLGPGRRAGNGRLWYPVVGQLVGLDLEVLAGVVLHVRQAMALPRQSKVDPSLAVAGDEPERVDRQGDAGANVCLGQGHQLRFAAGFSRQPLPPGNRFAIANNGGGPGVRATDATAYRGLELAILRPETLEPEWAKQPPAARLFGLKIFAPGGARIGSARITSGVKPKLTGVVLPGVETFSASNPADDRLSPPMHQGDMMVATTSTEPAPVAGSCFAVFLTGLPIGYLP